MISTQNLISFHIIENNNHKNFLLWTYPTLKEEHEKYILHNSFNDEYQNEFICSRKNSTWFNFYYLANNRKSAIVLLTKNFQPQMYKMLCHILAQKYNKTKNPVDLVKLYLNLYTIGSCSLQENVNEYSYNLETRDWPSNIKDFIQSFDLQIILLYTGILLKRRILVCHPNIQQLLNDLFAISKLVPTRDVEAHLYPLVNNLNHLRGLSFFVAGITDGHLAKNDAFYDIFIDMENREVTISPKAEEIMMMTKTHKEIAMFLVKLAQSELSEDEVVLEISRKTEEILDLLRSMALVKTEQGIKMLTINDLKSRKFQPALETFLFNLALAENLMML